MSLPNYYILVLPFSFFKFFVVMLSSVCASGAGEVAGKLASLDQIIIFVHFMSKEYMSTALINQSCLSFNSFFVFVIPVIDEHIQKNKEKKTLCLA